MAFQSSQYDYLLILNIPIPIHIENNEYIYLKTPSFEEYYTDIGYRRLEALFLVDIDDLESMASQLGTISEGYLDMLTGIRIKEDLVDTDKGMEIEKDAVRIFELITGATISKDGIWYNGVELTESDILEIRAGLLISIGSMDINGSLNHREDAISGEDEFDKKAKELQDKIDAIKGVKTDTQTSISPLDQIKTIIYELQIPIEELRKMNQYALRQFYEIAAEAPYDKVHQVAAGNGLLGENKPYKALLPKN